VAPNVVLTARHCISQNITTSVKCDEHGNSGNGDHVAGDIAPSKIGVYVGSEPNFTKPGATVVKEIIHNDSRVLCNHDIALLVLEAPLNDVPVMPIRLGRQPQKGEAIRTVGYGRNDQKLPTGTRIRRTEVPVLAVGKGLSASKTPLGPLEFEVGQATCQGDSGGPAISEGSNAVIGVVSRGGDCTDNYGHIYTMTAGHEDLFDRAFASAAAGEPAVEPMDAPIKYVEGANTGAIEDPGTGGGSQPKSCSVSAAGHNGRTGRDAFAALGLAAAVALVVRRRKRA
jgi:MYXO-CTERM domain-containing protein